MAVGNSLLKIREAVVKISGACSSNIAAMGEYVFMKAVRVAHESYRYARPSARRGQILKSCH